MESGKTPNDLVNIGWIKKDRKKNIENMSDSKMKSLIKKADES